MEQQAAPPLPRLVGLITEASTCEHCGGTRFRRAAGPVGRGDFNGGANYGARATEAPNPGTHCTCPGSAYWDHLLAQAPADERAAMSVAKGHWTRGLRAIRLPGIGEGDLTPAAWREFCRQRAADAPADYCTPNNPTEAPRTEAAPALPAGMRAPTLVRRDGPAALWSVPLWLSRSASWGDYQFTTQPAPGGIAVRGRGHAARVVRRGTCTCDDYRDDHRCIHTVLAAAHEALAAGDTPMLETPAPAPPAEEAPGAPPDYQAPGNLAIIQVPRGQIAPNPHNPRKRIDHAKLEELAIDLRARGVLVPLLVRTLPPPGASDTSYPSSPSDSPPVGDYLAWEVAPPTYQLVAGERRWRAAEIAGLPTLPCILRDDLSDQDVLASMLSENIQRADLTPIETARGLRDLAATGVTQTEIAARMGSSQTSISQALALLKLPETVQELIDAGKLGKSHGQQLLRWLEFPAYLQFVAQRAFAEKAPVDILAGPLPFASEAEAAQVLRFLDYRVPFSAEGCQGCDAYRKDAGLMVHYPVCLRPACYQAKVEEDARQKRDAQERAAAQAHAAGAAWLQQHSADVPAASTPADEPRTAGEQAPPPQLPKLSDLKWDSYQQMPRAAGDEPAGCKGDACPSLGMAISYGGEVVRVCFDAACHRRLKTAAAKAANKAAKEACKGRWAALEAGVRADCPGCAGRMLAQRAAAKLRASNKEGVAVALALAGLKWDPRLFAQVYMMRDGIEIQDRLATLAVEQLAIIIGTLDAYDDYSGLMSGGNSHTRTLDWLIGLLPAPPLEQRADQVYRHMEAQHRPHVNEIRASAGLPPLPEPPAPQVPAAPTTAPDPFRAPETPAYPGAPPCTGCGEPLDTAALADFEEAAAARAGDDLIYSAEDDLAIHIPTGLVQAKEPPGIAAYCPACAESICPELWAQRAARLATDPAPAELLPGDERDPEDAELVPAAPSYPSGHIPAPYRHRETGLPLVISQGIGGPGGGWMAFRLKPNGSLERVKSKNLPLRETAEDVLADISEWPGAELVPAEASRTGGEPAASSAHCSLCGTQIPPEIAGAWSRLEDDRRRELHALDGPLVRIPQDEGPAISRTGHWYCGACVDNRQICRHCGRSQVDHITLTDPQGWHSAACCLACHGLGAEE